MTFAIEWLALHIFGALVAKGIYIAGGQKETLVVIGKMEYLGKCFGNY